MGPDQLGSAEWVLVSAAFVAAVLVGMCLYGFCKGVSDGRKEFNRRAGGR
jgi:hypothetical protein